MKKIFMAIALCLMCAVNVFGEDCKFQKINYTDEITDGEYIICYETSTKIKIFQQFGESAVSVKKQNDSVVVCDDLLAWDFECISGSLYAISNADGQYLNSVKGTDVYGDTYYKMELSDTYGLTLIKNPSQNNSNGFVICVKEYANNIYHYSYDYVFYNIENNTFSANLHNTLHTSYEHGNPNTSIYKKVKNDNSVATSIDNINSRSNGIKYIIDGIMYIIYDSNIYNILGQKVN